MRTNKELIKIAIDNFYLFEKYHCGGLCIYIYALYYEECIIDRDELEILTSIIEKNIREKKWYNILNWYKPNYVTMQKNNYYWEKGLKEPRLKYLDYLLNKYENENT